MKRSEAETLILKYLKENSIQEIGPTEILELVQRIGMTPPIYYKRYNDALTGLVDIPHYRWESENE